MYTFGNLPTLTASLIPDFSLCVTPRFSEVQQFHSQFLSFPMCRASLLPIQQTPKKSWL